MGLGLALIRVLFENLEVQLLEYLDGLFLALHDLTSDTSRAIHLLAVLVCTGI